MGENKEGQDSLLRPTWPRPSWSPSAWDRDNYLGPPPAMGTKADLFSSTGSYFLGGDTNKDKAVGGELTLAQNLDFMSTLQEKHSQIKSPSSVSDRAEPSR